MNATEEEVGITSPSGGSVASDEQELTIYESVPESNVVPSLQFNPDLDVVVREGEECVRKALKEVEASDSLEDILQCVDFLSETVVEGVVDTRDLPLC